MEPELTLAKAEKRIHQRAAIEQQQQRLRAPAETKFQLESMSREQRVPHPNRRPSQQRHERRSGQFAKANTCRICGKDSHPIQQCPAHDAQCQKGKRTGHYTTKRLSKRVVEVTMQMNTLTTTEFDHPDDTFDPDTVFLNTVEGDSKDSGTSWNVMIKIANKQISLTQVLRSVQCLSQHGRNPKTHSS